MTHLALFDPGTLLAREFRNLFNNSGLDFSRLSAFTSDEDEVGGLIELGGGAVRIELLSKDSLSQVDLVVCASSTFREATQLVAHVHDSESSPTLLMMAPDTPSDTGNTLVEGVNLETTAGPILVSPSASVILTAQVLTHLQPLHLETMDITALQPATTLGEGAMQEVFGQARALLNFDTNLPKKVFGRQVAFSTTVAEVGGRDEDRQSQLSSLLPANSLGEPGSLAIQTLQTGSFHGLGMSISVRFEKPPDRRTLEEHLGNLGPAWRLGDSKQSDSTIDRADDPVATIELRTIQNRQAWLWVAADNLVHGNARNTVAIVEAWSTAQSN